MMLTMLMVCIGLISFGQKATEKLMVSMGGLQVTQIDTITPQLELMKTHKDIVNPKKETAKALKDSATQFLGFKKEADLKFSSNKKNIAVLRGKYLKADETDKACMEKISKLEQKNNELKKSLVDYKDGGKEDWLMFKNQFNYEMDELQNALKTFASDKIK